jgi:hypothetical protein
LSLFSSFGIPPGGYYLMVIIDEYSRYPVVDTLTSLTAKSVIPLLDKTFSIFGIPKELKVNPLV